MKNLAALLLAGVLALGFSTVSAAEIQICGIEGCGVILPHAHDNCPQADCLNYLNHEHDGVYYYGHYYGDSHDHNELNCRGAGCIESQTHIHGLCDIEGCDLTAAHAHNAIYYYGRHEENATVYCGFDGCTITDSHTHGKSCCGRSYSRGRHHEALISK